MLLRPGLSGSVPAVVVRADTAAALGSGDVPVLGTPRALALCEAATVAAVAAALEPGTTTVGTAVSLDHRRATPVGDAVAATARLREVEGPRLRFDVELTDAHGRLAASGTVERVVVERSRFCEAAARASDTTASGTAATPRTVDWDVDVLADRIRRLVAGRPRALVGLTGAPGAGKSTAAAALHARLEPDAVVVPMDGFHLSNALLAARDAAERKGAIDTFDAAGYLSLLQRLRAADAEVLAPGFDRTLEEPVAATIAVPASVPIVLTEGNYLLAATEPWSALRDLLDEVWFLELDDTTRLDRLTARHAQFGKPLAQARAWARGSDQRNADLVAATRDRADVVIRMPGEGAGNQGGPVLG